MNIELKRIGSVCKMYRASIGKTQVQVALETNYSVENISAFECGRNDNVRILLWYINNGLSAYDLAEKVKEERNENK